MLKIITKPSFLLSVITFLFFAFPIHTYNPDIELHKSKYNENLFLDKPAIPDTHKAFILDLIPLIQQSNQAVMLERERLLKIYSLVKNGKRVKHPEQQWLKKLEIKYHGKNNSFPLPKDYEKLLKYINELLSRVDMVPIRLAIAQSAIESGWGTSRFCIEGQAFFGIHCYKPGCGIKARLDDEGGFEVKSYNNAQESVDDYLLFLNSKRGMQNFRNERLNYFHKDSIPDLQKLTKSLKGYSGIGSSYHSMIESILQNYIPENIANN